MDKINLGDGTQGSGDSGFVGGGKINANYIALVEAILGVTIWSNASSENLDLTTLNTTDKSSIKAAINELLERTKLIDDSLTSSVFKTWSVDKLVATFLQASALADYLQLAGGTLTGALNGTSASFSSNLGIGTTSPSTKLMIEHNNDGAVGGTIRIRDRDSQQSENQLTGAIEFESEDATEPTSGVSTAIKAFAASSTGGSYLTISTTDISTSTLDERMRIDSSGNVGIGTMSPSAKLEVVGSSELGSSNYQIKTGSSVGNNSAIIHRKDSGGNLEFRAEFDDYNQLFLENGGNVGIGTTSPSQKLEVNGNVKASSFIKDGGTSSQFLKADGSVDSNSYASVSALSSYLPLDGSGTMTGSLLFDADNVTNYFMPDADGGGSSSGLSIGRNANPWGAISFYAEEENSGFTFFSMSSVTNQVAKINTNGDMQLEGVILPKTNNVQTISGSTSSATIGTKINVVVVDTSVDCTLTIATSTNIASIKVINIGTGGVYLSAGTSVTVNDNGGHIGVASSNKLYLSATLTKIATNSWIVSE